MATAVLAVTVATWAVVWELPGRETGSDAFLERVFAEMAAVRSMHTTSTGTMVMTDGSVVRFTTEGDWVFPANSRFRNTFEECAFPFGSYGRGHLCSLESLVVDGIMYERETTDEGPGEWKTQDVSPWLPDSESPPSPSEILESMRSRYGLIELDEESIDGVVYRRFRGTWNPEERMIERLEAGDWEPPAEVSREEMIAILQRSAETTTRTVEVWVGKDDYLVWKMRHETERLASDALTRRGIPIPTQQTVIIENSRYNEPVVIEPPI